MSAIVTSALPLARSRMTEKSVPSLRRQGRAGRRRLPRHRRAAPSAARAAQVGAARGGGGGQRCSAVVGARSTSSRSSRRRSHRLHDHEPGPSPTSASRARTSACSRAASEPTAGADEETLFEEFGTVPAEGRRRGPLPSKALRTRPGMRRPPSKPISDEAATAGAEASAADGRGDAAEGGSGGRGPRAGRRCDRGGARRAEKPRPREDEAAGGR